MAQANVYAPPPAATHRKALVICLLGLAGFLAAEALLLRSFNRTDKTPPSWDQSIHMEIALDYKEAIKDGRLSDAWHLAPKPGMPPFPPLYHLLLMRSFASADPAHAALWINWLYLALLSVSVFGIAWRFRADDTALAAVLLVCASTGVQELYTTQLVDLPLMAIAAAAYWALLASEDFTQWIPSLLFGALHAAGMLHKWSFFSYMLPAYYVAVRASRTKMGTVIMLASMALSAALLMPWYMAHLALLPSRLVQASSDFAVSAKNVDAWFIYLKLVGLYMGPVMMVMGVISLLTPQFPRRRDQGYVMLAWFAAAYVFWTIVPNRQARFLAPAMAPLGIAFCSTWPKKVTWLAVVFQVFSMFNFFGGWVGPSAIDFPYFSFDFFQNRPASTADWKTEEILRKVEADRDPTRPVTNVTLVANDDYFNAPTFHWTQRRLGLEHARMRSVNSRLCELSEFVLLKDPKLGPPSVTGGLPAAVAEIKDERGWFKTAYEEDGRWNLPDGSTAILYRQKRGMRRPYDGRQLVYQLYNIGKLDIVDLKAAFGPWDPTTSTYASAAITARRIEFRGLMIQGPNIDLYDLGFVPVGSRSGGGSEWSDMRLMRLGRLRVNSLDIGAPELITFLDERVKDLKVSSLTLDKTIKLAGTYKGHSVSAEAALVLLDSPRRLKIDILNARIGPINLSSSTFKEIKELEIPLYPNPDTPFAIELAGLTVKNGRLTVP